MSETMFQAIALAGYTKLDPKVIGGSNGGKDLSGYTLNAAIINARGARAAMTFETTDSSDAVIPTYSFSLNPQRIQRTAKAIEAEIVTMASFHTYRWMIEPPVWSINGYAGFLGQAILQNIVDLDGQDNILWRFPYVFPNPRQVKVVSTGVQYDDPYSIRYSIVLRELPAIVRNYFSTVDLVNRGSNPFVAPSFNSTASAVATGTEDINTNDTSTQMIANRLFNEHKTKLDPRGPVLTSLIEQMNNLKMHPSWEKGYPTDDFGNTITRIGYPTS